MEEGDAEPTEACLLYRFFTFHKIANGNTQIAYLSHFFLCKGIHPDYEPRGGSQSLKRARHNMLDSSNYGIIWNQG